MAEWEAETEQFDTTTCRAAQALPRPDIYYLILDGFGRADVLRDLYQMELDGWIDGLRQTGFYVADRSTANYGQTMLSLASALNVDYVNELAGRVDHQSANRLPLEVMLEENRVFQFLRCAGYHLVYFPTGYVSVDIVTGVDQSVTPPGSPGAYQMELIGTTPVPDLLEVVLQQTPRDYYRARMLYTLDHLKDATRLDGPVFVMAHVLAPHPPFVFGAQGEPLEAKDHRVKL